MYTIFIISQIKIQVILKINDNYYEYVQLLLLCQINKFIVCALFTLLKTNIVFYL